MNKIIQSPKNRGPLRLALGKAYFRLRRRIGDSSAHFAGLLPETKTETNGETRC